VSKGPIGDRIKAEREKLGYSRRAFAFKMNPEQPESTRRALYFWETNQREPSEKNRRAIAEALGLPPSTFNGDQS
jgi:transcriptional regulator with XRE-family HTH domain